MLEEPLFRGTQAQAKVVTMCELFAKRFVQMKITHVGHNVSSKFGMVLLHWVHHSQSFLRSSHTHILHMVAKSVPVGQLAPSLPYVLAPVRRRVSDHWVGRVYPVWEATQGVQSSRPLVLVC